MAESDQRATVVRALNKAGLHAVPVENMLRKGFPDIDFSHGLIETKWLRSWPKREETPVRLPHYTQEQKIFHLKRWRASRNCWVILQCGKDWLLFTGQDAAYNLGEKDRPTLFRIAVGHWTSRAEFEKEFPTLFPKPHWKNDQT